MEQDLNEVLKAWRIQTCVINSKIHAYFPTAKAQGTLLHLQWKKFSARVEEYYQEWRERFNAAESEYWEGRRELLFGEKSAIIISILSSKITGFQHKPGI